MDPTSAFVSRRTWKSGRLLFEFPIAVLLALAGVYLFLVGRASDGGITLLADHEVLVTLDHVTGELTSDDRPGAHAFLPWLEEVRRLDRRTVRYVMGEDPEADRAAPALIVRGRDGSSWTFARVEVHTALDPERAGVALVDHGGTRESVAKFVDAIARPVLRDAFGRYTPREIVLPDSKQAATDEALRELRSALAPHGIVVSELSVSKPQFSEDYQKTITRRKVADQDIERFVREREQLLANREERAAEARDGKERELAALALQLEEGLLEARRAADRAKREADQEADDRTVAARLERDGALARAAAIEERQRSEARAFEAHLAALEARGDLAVRAALVERLSTFQLNLEPYEAEAEPGGEGGARRTASTGGLQ